MDAEASNHDHEAMTDLFEARDVDRVIEMMARHRGIAVEAVALWQARDRP